MENVAKWIPQELRWKAECDCGEVTYLRMSEWSYKARQSINNKEMPSLTFACQGCYREFIQEPMSKEVTFKYNQEEVQKAVRNYFDQDDFEGDNTWICEEMSNDFYREEIIALRKALEYFQIKLLDFEIHEIWRKHSDDWDASWLGTSKDAKKDLWVFEKFVDEWLPKDYPRESRED